MPAALEEIFPGVVAEHRFHPVRKWRFDYAWPDKRVALEVEGGAWIQGRHTRGAGFVKDLEKYNTAAAAGWTVIRVTPQMLRDGRAHAWLAPLLEARTLPDSVFLKRQAD